MGQYQQWLLCQETDQSLRTKREQLEAELAALRERARLLEQSLPRGDNQLIRILIEAFSNDAQRSGAGRAQSQQKVPAPLERPSEVGHGLPLEGGGRLTPRMLPPLVISPAFEPEGMLSSPSATHGRMGEPSAQTLPQQLPQQPSPALPSSPGESTLAEESAPLPAEQQVAPHDLSHELPIELPAWLHHLTISSGKDHRRGPIDQESMRTNRLVQRWLERWGRIPPSPGPAVTPPEDAINE